MPKLWVLKGLRKGILTTQYPKASPTEEEIPRFCIPPEASSESDWKKGSEICPTGAIIASSEGDAGRMILGKCIYCQKCSAAGFGFNRSNSLNSASFAIENTNETVQYDEIYKKYASLWKTFKRSFHVLMMDVGSCNACNLEVMNLSNPYYDLNRLGIFFTNSPKHTDALIVVGALNKAMVDALKRTYSTIPNPKLVIAVGACPMSGGVFQGTEGFAGPVDDHIPVDVTVPGCPPSPVQILEGLLLAMGKKVPQGAK
jgi:Ni,Fe-hydrogenase III small subunit